MATDTVDTRQFTQMCRSLAREVGKPLPKVQRAEVGKVLEKAASYTRSASVAKIRARYADFVPMGMDAYSPQRSRRAGNLKGGNLVYYMGNHYPAALWSRLKARQAQLIARKRMARGLAKRSWLELANQLGVQINVPGYVAAAVPSTGQQYQNTEVKEETGAGKSVITIINSQPTVIAIGGRRALQAAIDGRTKFYYDNMKRGVFNSIKDVARAYPGLRIQAT